MLTVFLSSLSPMLMMFTCIAIGYALNKFNILPENAGTVLSRVTVYAFLPALNISTLMKYGTVEILLAKGHYILISVGILLVAMALSYPLSKLFYKEGYQRNVYKYALTFGNFGFIGNAVVSMILGDEGLFNFLLFTIPLSIGCNSWGMSLMIPKDNLAGSPVKRILTPPVIGMIAGLILGITNAQTVMPDFVLTTLSNLKGCLGPVSMVLTGFVVAKYDFRGLLKNSKVYVASLFRLVILPAVFLTVLLLLKVDSTIVLMALFAYATPLGLNTVVFPSMYGEDSSTGASMAMISCTLSNLTLPLLYAVVSIFL